MKKISTLLLLLFIQFAQAQHIRYLFEFGKPGTNNGEFNQPSGIDIDPKGKIYVTDYTGNRVQVFDTLGNYQTKIINPNSLAGTFNVPSSVCVSKTGDIFISEFYVIHNLIPFQIFIKTSSSKERRKLYTRI